MLGSMCYRLFTRNFTHHSVKVVLAQDHDISFRVYSKQLTPRSYVSTPSLPRSSSWPSLHDASTKEVGNNILGLGDVKRSFPYTTSCLKECSEMTYATIWHGLLPSHHPSILDQDTLSILKGRMDVHHLGFLPWNHSRHSSREQGLLGLYYLDS